MIIDQRIYTLKPENLETWLAGWKQTALPLHKELLGTFLGMYKTGVGPSLCEVMLFWAYASMADREMRLQRLAQHPKWKAYLQTTVSMAPVVARSRILRPTEFAPLPVPLYDV